MSTHLRVDCKIFALEMQTRLAPTHPETRGKQSFGSLRSGRAGSPSLSSPRNPAYDDHKQLPGISDRSEWPGRPNGTRRGSTDEFRE